jgi:hypothetical protein
LGNFNMFKRLVSTAAALSMLVSSSSLTFASPKVAEIISSNGKVLVNRGEGFFPAESFAALSAGDRIMVGADSGAVIGYSFGGCSVTLSPTSLMTVPAKAPCARGEQVAMADGFVITPTFGGDSTILLILAVILIGAGIFVLADNDDDSPISAP